jgi:hypothetical protein
VLAYLQQEHKNSEEAEKSNAFEKSSTETAKSAGAESCPNTVAT